VDPVEINAGTYYLRGLRSDDRIDDRPALLDLGESDPDRHLAECVAGWASGTRYTWAVCEPTTGELVAEAILDPVAAAVTARARSGHAEAVAVATASVRRFAAGALGLTVTG